MSRFSHLVSPRFWVDTAVRYRAVSIKAVSFALVGMVNTVVDYSAFLVARALLSRSPEALTLFGSVADSCRCATAATVGLIAANMMSWTVAVTGSFIMNSSFTFAAESGGKLRWRAFVPFLGSNIVGWIANTTTLVIAAQKLLLPVYIAKAIAVLASFVVNFSLAHFVVFRVRHRPAIDVGKDG
jgi:putative flippase GtrA